MVFRRCRTRWAPVGGTWRLIRQNESPLTPSPNGQKTLLALPHNSVYGLCYLLLAKGSSSFFPKAAMVYGGHQGNRLYQYRATRAHI